METDMLPLTDILSLFLEDPMYSVSFSLAMSISFHTDDINKVIAEIIIVEGFNIPFVATELEAEIRYTLIDGLGVELTDYELHYRTSIVGKALYASLLETREYISGVCVIDRWLGNKIFVLCLDDV